MALTLPLPEVPESRTLNGVGSQTATFLVIPGTSDYPTGGYIISAQQCRLQRIIGASVDGGNSTTLGWLPSITIAYTLGTNNIPNVPTSLAFQVEALVVTAGTSGNAVTLNAGTTLEATGGGTVKQSEIAAATNLTGCIWSITVTGY